MAKKINSVLKKSTLGEKEPVLGLKIAVLVPKRAF